MNCKVHRYDVVKTPQGNIFKLIKLNKKNSSNKELYISEVKKNYKKGWNLHTKHTCLIFLIEGEVKFKVYKNKKNSKIKLFNLSFKRNNILEIPPQHWFSFETTKYKSSKILNLLSGFHSRTETKKKPIKYFKNPLK